MSFSATPKTLILAEAGEAEASSERLETPADEKPREVWGCSGIAHVLNHLKKASRGDVEWVSVAMDSAVILWDECDSGRRLDRPVQNLPNRLLQPRDRAATSLFLN